MTRQIALDTETTGKSDDGTPGEHRIIEIGCVEIVDRTITGKQLRLLINPEREVDAGAEAVHGLNYAMLRDKPVFSAVSQQVIDFITGAELLIHNARFDTGFLDHEWQLMGLKQRTRDLCTITDTVALAKRLHPNSLVNLNNLCRLYGIDTSARTLHGALLDAQLLAEVYLAMTGGQLSLNFDAEGKRQARQWQRPPGASLPLMQVDSLSHAQHLSAMAALLQPQLTPDSQGCLHAVSAWSDAISITLETDSGADKKIIAEDFARQRDALLEKLLSAEERQLLRHNQ